VNIRPIGLFEGLGRTAGKMQYTMEGKEKKEWDTFLFQETRLGQTTGYGYRTYESFEKDLFMCFFQRLWLPHDGSVHPLSAESFDILIRFAKVLILVTPASTI
jgi:hypothetical protein